MGLVMVGAELELVAFALGDDQPLGTIAVATLAQTLADDRSRNARDRNQSPDTATVVTDIRVVSLVSVDVVGFAATKRAEPRSIVNTPRKRLKEAHRDRLDHFVDVISVEEYGVVGALAFILVTKEQ